MFKNTKDTLIRLGLATGLALGVAAGTAKRAESQPDRNYSPTPTTETTPDEDSAAKYLARVVRECKERGGSDSKTYYDALDTLMNKYGLSERDATEALVTCSISAIDNPNLTMPSAESPFANEE